MWLRLAPWVWERLELPYAHRRYSRATFEGKLNAIANSLRTEILLATNIRYFRVLSPGVWADLCSLKVHDALPLAAWDPLSSVHQMLRVPPKSPYARDKGDGLLLYDPAPERT